MRLELKHYRRLGFVLFASLGLAISLFLPRVSLLPAAAKTTVDNSIIQAQVTVNQQEQRGKEFYRAGKFAQAIEAWQQALQNYQLQENFLARARILSNLCVAYQQLGQWEQAKNAIATSLNLLNNQVNDSSSSAYLSVLAQALNNQGGWQFALGQIEEALQTWQQAGDIYQKADDEIGVTRSQINQAQALQTLGFYRRALKQLEAVEQALHNQPPSHLKAVGLTSLGNLLRLTGNLEGANQFLQQGLAVAKQLHSNEDIGTALLGLGNTARVSQDSGEALSFYEQGLTISTASKTRTQLQLAQLSLLLETEQWNAAQLILSPLQSSLDKLPASQSNIYAQINFARSLIKLKQAQEKGKFTTKTPSWQEIATLLATVVERANSMGNQRGYTYALGNLAEVYEHAGQLNLAQKLTEKALLKAQAIQAPDIIYRWQWQLGRLLAAQGNSDDAMAAYGEAVNTLHSLRSDLVAINSEVQFSFQETVEPVYRQFVSLLLKSDGKTQVSQKNLAKARQIIESFQLAELDNFLQEACLDSKPESIEQIDQKAAVIYPIILDERLEVIIRLPNQPLQHYAIPVSAPELENVIDQLRQGLVIRSRRDFYAPSQQLYDWLIRPVADELAHSGIETLVFVPDGSLRNIPMATLYDGEQFLVEKYSVALAPGLQLIDPQPLQASELKTLAAGLTKERQGFTPLSHVERELETIHSQIASTVLIDQAFTTEALQEQLKSADFPVIHIATHGQFSSKLVETFLLTWDSRIDINQLDSLLQSRNDSHAKTIELLVLSACETATGDKRAALGLAGMAVRAGARSTLATLWSVNDQATADLMSQFYQGLSEHKLTKAAALRRGQLELLKDPLYRHPYYWSPYVLVGNWL